jgi:DNA-binding NtrC family response regulator
LELLQEYSYPGNIRELKNVVASAYYSTPGAVIEAKTLPQEVRREGIAGIPADAAVVAKLYREILEGKGGFEDLVKEPFLKHKFGSSLVKSVIQRALKDAGGSYRDALMRLRVPDRRYSVTIQFLKRHQCYLDFRPYRHSRNDSCC